MGPSENEQLVAAVAGNRDALAALLRRHGPDVRRRLSISAVWRAALDPADVMQATYLEAFLRIGQLDSHTIEGFISWLTQVAKNNLRDAIKELERQKRPDPRRQVVENPVADSYVALLDVVGCTTRTASREAARHEAHDLLKAALTRLTETYRAVVRLYDLEGKSATEVAEILGRSTGAVFMLRARAHDRLRELLGSESKFFSNSA
jgi:RNA polymerase sigma-70 factor (ECF subfamily)